MRKILVFTLALVLMLSVVILCGCDDFSSVTINKNPENPSGYDVTVTPTDPAKTDDDPAIDPNGNGNTENGDNGNTTVDPNGGDNGNTTVDPNEGDNGNTTVDPDGGDQTKTDLESVSSRIVSGINDIVKAFNDDVDAFVDYFSADPPIALTVLRKTVFGNSDSYTLSFVKDITDLDNLDLSSSNVIYFLYAGKFEIENGIDYRFYVFDNEFFVAASISYYGTTSESDNMTISVGTIQSLDFNEFILSPDKYAAPVIDMANSVKGQISNWYVALSERNAKWDPTKEVCLGGYLRGVFSDATFETAVKSFNENTAAPITDDNLHIATSDLGTTANGNYKRLSSFTVYVYSRYCYIPITITINQGVGIPSVGEYITWSSDNGEDPEVEPQLGEVKDNLAHALGFLLELESYAVYSNSLSTLDVGSAFESNEYVQSLVTETNRLFSSYLSPYILVSEPMDVSLSSIDISDPYKIHILYCGVTEVNEVFYLKFYIFSSKYSVLVTVRVNDDYILVVESVEELDFNDFVIGSDSSVTPTTPTLTPEQEACNVILNYAKAWVMNNAATEADATDLSILLGDIVKSDELKKIVKNVKVVDGSDALTITIIYRNNEKETLLINKVEADLGIKAGVDFRVAYSLGADETIGKLISAAMKTIKKAVDNGASFDENGFSFKGEAYFEFFYGDDMKDKLVYSISASGRIAKEAKDTFAALEVKDGDKVLGGLYYDGSALSVDCKIYLLLNIDEDNSFKYYIDHADLNSLIGNVFAVVSNVAFDEQELNTAEQTDEEKFYEKFANTERLTDLFGDMEVSVKGIIGSILDVVLSSGYTKVGDELQYQLKIDIDELLSFLSGMSIFSEIDINELPAPLNQLDIGSFQGIGGVLVITANVLLEDGTLGAFELSYNCPKQDFRWSAFDAQPKVYGPINVALGVKNLSFDENEKLDVLPSANELEEYLYFSPFNFELESTFTTKLNDNVDTYIVKTVSDVNPFNIADGVVKIDILNAANGEVTTIQFSFVEIEDGFDALVVARMADGTQYSGYYVQDGLVDLIPEVIQKLYDSNTPIAPVLQYIDGLSELFFDEAYVIASKIEQDPIGSLAKTIVYITATKEVFDVFASYDDEEPYERAIYLDGVANSVLTIISTFIENENYDDLYDLPEVYVKMDDTHRILYVYDKKNNKTTEFALSLADGKEKLSFKVGDISYIDLTLGMDERNYKAIDYPISVELKLYSDKEYEFDFIMGFSDDDGLLHVYFPYGDKEYEISLMIDSIDNERYTSFNADCFEIDINGTLKFPNLNYSIDPAKIKLISWGEEVSIERLQSGDGDLPLKPYVEDQIDKFIKWLEPEESPATPSTFDYSQLLRSMNAALACDFENEHNTMTDVIECLKSYGFDYLAYCKNYNTDFLWDSVNDVICCLSDGKIVYIPDMIDDYKKLSVNDYRLWKVYFDTPDLDDDYSIYIVSQVVADYLEDRAIDVGLDVGEYTVGRIVYQNNGSYRHVAIRTQSAATELVINAPLDDVDHYGLAGSVIVDSIGG